MIAFLICDWVFDKILKGNYLWKNDQNLICNDVHDIVIRSNIIFVFIRYSQGVNIVIQPIYFIYLYPRFEFVVITTFFTATVAFTVTITIRTFWILTTRLLLSNTFLFFFFLLTLIFLVRYGPLQLLMMVRI